MVNEQIIIDVLMKSRERLEFLSTVESAHGMLTQDIDDHQLIVQIDDLVRKIRDNAEIKSHCEAVRCVHDSGNRTPLRGCGRGWQEFAAPGVRDTLVSGSPGNSGIFFPEDVA